LKQFQEAAMPRKSALPKNPGDDSEVLWGARAIGQAINRSPTQVHWLIRNRATNGIPVDVIGHRTIRSTRARLEAWAAGDAQ
jgi:hypothetical protein